MIVVLDILIEKLNKYNKLLKRRQDGVREKEKGI